MNMTKKRTLYGLIITTSLVVLAISGSLMLRSHDKRGDKVAPVTQEKPLSGAAAEIDTLIRRAEAARASRQYDEAAGLYHQARTHYEQAGDIEKLAEIDAILSLLEVEKNNTPEPVKPKLAGES